MKLKKENSNLKTIRDELERRLIIMRYSKESTSAYMRIFDWVEGYLTGYGELNYSKEFGQRFLIEYPLQANHGPTMYRVAKTVIRRIDEILENKLFSPCFHKKKLIYPARFTNMLERYIESLIKRGFKKNTINNRKRNAEQFFSQLPKTVLSLEDLSAVDLYDVFTKYEWLTDGLTTARGVLTFLFDNKVTKTNLTACVPKPTRPRVLPSIYSRDEIEQLLTTVDRASNNGKRDYAILILAARLGLRSSDIVNLSFKDIDRTAKTIEIIQVKTERPQKLVMNQEIEEAIDDYIQNGRPQSSSNKIFLRFRAPFTPLTAATGFSIASKYFSLGGIASMGRRRGTHALRASYATALITKGIPYTVVQKALGHDDPESAKYYVRVDARRLRMCALDVPKPTGAFAVMLEPEVRNILEGVL